MKSDNLETRIMKRIARKRSAVFLRADSKDRHLIEQLANVLGTNPGLVEKDWQVVRALGVLASLDHAGGTPVFFGRT